MAIGEDQRKHNEERREPGSPAKRADQLKGYHEGPGQVGSIQPVVSVGVGQQQEIEDDHAAAEQPPNRVLWPPRRQQERDHTP
ncbi:MAG: hypothetical protein WBD38_01545 [Candidatus Dormiibacterota bacterium]